MTPIVQSCRRWGHASKILPSIGPPYHTSDTEQGLGQKPRKPTCCPNGLRRSNQAQPLAIRREERPVEEQSAAVKAVGILTPRWPIFSLGASGRNRGLVWGPRGPRGLGGMGRAAHTRKQQPCWPCAAFHGRRVVLGHFCSAARCRFGRPAWLP